MSWRLALSVLVPVLGGVALDNQFNTSPALLFAGFAVAIVLAVITIRRTLRITNQLTFITPDKPEKPRD